MASRDRAPVHVRRARIADVTAIGRLLHDFNREFEVVSPNASWLAERVGQLLALGDTVVLLVWDEAERDTDDPDGCDPDGLCVMRLRPALWSSGLECYLAELYVVPHRRGRGLGRALMEVAVSVARERGADTMNIEVDEPDQAARNLYESLGFTNRQSAGAGALMFVYERDL